MELTGMVKVNGLSERQYQGKVYRSANLYIDGADADSVKAGIPDTAVGLPKQVQALMDQRCKATFNLRVFKGTMYLDLQSLEPLPHGAVGN